MKARNVLFLVAAISAAGSVLPAQTLTSVAPTGQRVGELITLRGSGFGTLTATSRVELVDGTDTWTASAVYVWRDDFIQVRVPSGKFMNGAPVPVSKSPTLEVRVVTTGGNLSNELPFRVAAFPGAPRLPSYVELTNIVNDRDTSTFLGNTSFNLARTKDAEVGDIDGDGWMDLLDNNSSNLTNDTFGVYRRNLGGTGFEAIRFEPRTSSDTGTFAVEILPSGTYPQDFSVYDGDLVDLTNDGFPDWVQALRDGSDPVRVAINNYQGEPGRFLESTDQWITGSLSSGSPDDIAHIDANLDGWPDVAIAFRFDESAQVLLNVAGERFAQPIDVEASGGGTSIHDVVFTRANDDIYPDMLLVNESGNSKLFLHDGEEVPSWDFDRDIPYRAQAGVAGDLNGDGAMDLVFGGTGEASVFINDPSNLGNYFEIELANTDEALFYDAELGDINLDGQLDILMAAVPLGFNSDPEDTLRVWLTRGNANVTFTAVPLPSQLFPDLEGYQRMSADLIDFDNDGDLDFYLTGADGEGMTGFGDVANQFWENTLVP